MAGQIGTRHPIVCIPVGTNPDMVGDFFPLIIRILNKIRSFYQVSSLKLLNNSIQVYNRDTEIMRKNVQTGIKLFLLILAEVIWSYVYKGNLKVLIISIIIYFVEILLESVFFLSVF